jgi:hydrogenase/urease accessory protein HupE
MTVVPGGPVSMGGQLLQWFLYCAFIGLFAGYIAGRALPAGADYLAVFRFTGATAFSGYSLAQIQQSIWYKRSWGTTFRNMLDGLLYGLLTGGVFGWLWPH